MRRTLILLGAGLVLAGPFVLGYRISEGSRATTPVAIPSVVDEVRNALASRYYRPVPENAAVCIQHDGDASCVSRRSRDTCIHFCGPPIIACPSCWFSVSSRSPIAE